VSISKRASAAPGLFSFAALFKRVEILDRKRDVKSASAAAPAIAFEATDQSLAMTVDLDNPFPATVAVHYRLFLITRAFCRSVISSPGRRFTASS
jgi:hypothetical protein